MNSADKNDFIRKLKLQVYLRTLHIGLLVIVVVWGLFISDGKFLLAETYIFPVSFIFCVGSLILFKIYGSQFLEKFEKMGFGFVFLYFLVQFIQEALLGLKYQGMDTQKFLLWIAILYLLAFLIFPSRNALRWSFVFIFCLVVIGVSYGIARWGKPGFGRDLNLIVQIYSSGFVYVSLLYAITQLKEKYWEAKNQSEMMRLLADTDRLTGACSRKNIEETLESYIAETDLHNIALSVMMLDVDGLKRINDTYGHVAGDDILRGIVKVLHATIRENDRLGRIGGDEFLLICPNADLTQAKILAERLKKNISGTEFEIVGKVSVSVGVAALQEGDTLQTLVKRADIDLYSYKNNQRILKNY